MADVPGKFFRATKVRTGVSPSSPGAIEGEVLPPLNPPGGGINSIGLTMPSAFNVANSPLTSNGSLDVTGAGTTAQYIRGDGSLADFPESSGGGSSVSYYLNGSVNQGTISGIAFKELNKVPILGAGTDFTIAADGYIASFVTDAGDPALLEIPGGNWNFETYFSASSSGGTPTFYVELYKLSGTTLTLIASNSGSPEFIAFGTTLTSYFSTLAVPTTTLALTDRLAIRYYVNHSGRTITLHTENNHLCQIITTFTTGLTALNGLTAQVQTFATGTSGTDFNISSATSIHTFNLPTANATNRGALSSADWSLFTAAYNDKINSASVTGTTTKTLTLTQQDGGTITASWTDLNTDAVTSVFGRTGAVVAANGDYTTAQVTESGNLYYTDARSRAALSFAAGSGAYNTSTGVITIPTNNNQITNGAGYITSADLSGYVPTSRTITINGTTQDLSANRTFNVGTVTSVTASSPLASSGGTTPNITIQQASGSQSGFLSSTDWTTFNNKQNALTNPVTGTGTTNYLPKFTGASTIGNSQIFDNGSGVGIGTASITQLLTVNGEISAVTRFRINPSTQSNQIFGDGNAFSISGSNNLGIRNDSGSIVFASGGANVQLLLNTSGNLLVGTTTDNGARLQVSGATDNVFNLTRATVGTWSFNLPTSGNLFLTNRFGTNVFQIADLGAATFSSSVTANGNFGTIAANTSTAPQYYLTQTGGNTYSAIGINRADGTGIASGIGSALVIRSGDATNFPIQFATANNIRMTITSGGNVGIDTSNPLGSINNSGLQIARGGHTTLMIGDGFNNGGVLQSSDNVRRMFMGANIYDDEINSWSQFVDNSGYAAFDAIGGTTNGLARILVGSPADSGYGGGNIFFEAYKDNSTSYVKLRTNTDNVLYLTNSGNVLIGTTTDSGQRLQVNGIVRILDGNNLTLMQSGNGNGSNIRSVTNGDFRVTTGGTPDALIISNAGAATFSSSVTATSFFESSDSSLKTLVEDNYQAEGIANVTAKLYIKNGKKELGYYAQDLQSVLPSSVNKGSDGLLNLSYREVHTAKIAYLEEEIRQLKKRYENN